MTQAYSLQWPPFKARTQNPGKALFRQVSMEVARGILMNELRLLRAENVVLSTNIELRRDGAPYSGRRLPEDRGVAVYFTRKGKTECIPCDRWQRIEDNVLAIARSVEAIRGIERWGGGDMMERAFSGFLALPSPIVNHANWWDTLGLDQRATMTAIILAYRELALVRHPDAPGGSEVAMSELNAAYEQAKKERVA